MRHPWLCINGSLVMFLSKHSELYLDLSSDLRESEDWNVGTLRPLEYLLDVVSFAIEPLSGLLAIGMAKLRIHDRLM
jgi:syntaxin-binding protein 5